MSTPSKQATRPPTPCDRAEPHGSHAWPPQRDGRPGPHHCPGVPRPDDKPIRLALAFTISKETLLGGEFGEGMELDDYIREIGLPSGGAVRASMGIVSNFADVHRFTQFAGEFIDLADVPGDLPPRTVC